SKEELAAAETSLHRLDLDEDEMLTTAEIAPDLFNRNPYDVEFAYATGMRRAGAQKVAFVAVSPGQPGQLVPQLLLHYDKDRNKKLSQKEIGLDKSAFDQLDKNHDGQLDEKELAQFLSQPIDLELIVRLGPMNDLASQITQKLFKTSASADLYSAGGKKS